MDISINPTRKAVHSLAGSCNRADCRVIGMHLSGASTCACRGQQPYHSPRAVRLYKPPVPFAAVHTISRSAHLLWT
jgi:hypothetical protein